MIGLKYLRMMNELSLQQVADELGVSKQTINKWEKGTPIPEARVEQLMKLFNIKSKRLLTKEVEGDFDFNVNNEEVSKIEVNELVEMINKFKGKKIKMTINTSSMQLNSISDSFNFKVVRKDGEYMFIFLDDRGESTLPIKNITNYESVDNSIKISVGESFLEILERE